MPQFYYGSYLILFKSSKHVQTGEYKAFNPSENNTQTELEGLPPPPLALAAFSAACVLSSRMHCVEFPGVHVNQTLAAGW